MPASYRLPCSPVLVYEYLSAGGTVSAADQELLTQGVAMRDAMLADLATLAHVESVCVISERAGWPSGTSAATESLRPGETHAQLLQRAASQGWAVWAVAPECGGLLENLARVVPATQWLGCTPEAIACAASKSATVQQLAAHSLPVPDPQRHSGAGWVVKPDDGAGCDATRWHASAHDAQRDLAGRADAAVVEPWVPGQALSASLCCGSGGMQLLSVNRQHIARDERGMLHYRGVTPAALPVDSTEGRRIAALAEGVVHALPGLRGFVGIDLTWHVDQGPVIIEVNPRVTSAYVGLSAQLGFNVAQRVLEALR